MMIRSAALIPLTLALLASVPAPLLAATKDTAVHPGAPTTAAKPSATAASPGTKEGSIVAIVNGDVISRDDVSNRGRLFAISSGLPMTQDVLDRLGHQVTRQLIDERLRLQESQRRHVIISDQQIAGAIKDIETRNNMPAGALRAKLQADGVGLRTLIDQIRVQLAWTQVLRQQLGTQAQVTDTEIAEQQRLIAQQTGKPEYRIAEIFIPIDDPANKADAQRFAETVITQLHAGAPFPVAAAEFSQSQTALQGGDLGWMQPNQLDPGVARIAADMPIGAISNPIAVPGGFSIITVRAKREIGRDMATMLSLRQAFIPFSTPLNPAAPTEQQHQALDKAKSISASVRTCDAMEAANRSVGAVRPADPGPVRLENVNPPPLRQLLASLPFDHASQPLVAGDGIAVVIVCSRDQKNIAEQSPEDVRNQILSERIELASRQLQRDLQRRATIDRRDANAS